MLPWWETKSKGIAIFSLSPFYQRAVPKYGSELLKITKQTFKNAIIFLPLLFGAYGLIKWAEYDNRSRKRKPKE
jgi:uncharacterized membrane protein YidH (DUF202 family)